MKRIVLFVNLILLTLMLSPLTASAAPADGEAQQQAITDMLSTVSQEKNSARTRTRCNSLSCYPS